MDLTGRYDDTARALAPAGRRTRAVATAIVGALLLLGTWRGTDDHFPLGPFLMFAGRNPPTADVNSAFVQGVTADGAVREVSSRASGYRRAELEGQLAELQRDPSQLEDIATAATRRAPGAPPYVVIRVVQRRFYLVDRRVRGYTDVVLAEWRRP